MRNITPALIFGSLISFAIAGCNTPQGQQLGADLGVIAGSVAQIECARINPAKIPVGVTACTTIAGDVVSLVQAQAQGALAKK